MNRCRGVRVREENTQCRKNRQCAYTGDENLPLAVALPIRRLNSVCRYYGCCRPESGSSLFEAQRRLDGEIRSDSLPVSTDKPSVNLARVRKNSLPLATRNPMYGQPSFFPADGCPLVAAEMGSNLLPGVKPAIPVLMQLHF